MCEILLESLGPTRLSAAVVHVDSINVQRIATATSLKNGVIASMQDAILSTVFQPIVNLLDGQVVGYEALGRLAGREAEGFAPVASWARAQRSTSETLRQLQNLALDQGAGRPHGTLLFFNGRLAAVPNLSKRGEDWSQIVVEVPESGRRLDLWDSRLKNLRNAGLQVAIDDWGVGVADPLRLVHIRPHWLKIDVALVRRVAEPDTSRLLELLVRWVNPATQIIAEGIENAIQLETLRKLGIRYGQGFFLARPSDEWLTRVDIPVPAVRLAGLQRVPMALSLANRLTDDTLAVIESGRSVLSPLLADAIHELIRWIQTTPMVRLLIEMDAGRYADILREHFDQLTRGTLDAQDITRSARIAHTHQRFGIDLSYFVTGYRLIQAAIARDLRRRGYDTLAEAVRPLFDWDLSVALQEYQQMLDQDGLTGTFTREAFIHRVIQDINVASLGERSAVLVLLDFRGISALIQRRGHVVADRTLARIGQRLRDFAASSYLVGRIGGQVFGLWAGYRQHESIRRDMQSLEVAIAHDHPGVSFVYGTATLGSDGTTWEALYAHVDQALVNSHHEQGWVPTPT